MWSHELCSNTRFTGEPTQIQLHELWQYVRHRLSSLVHLAPSLIVCLTLKKTQNQDADFDGPQILNTSTLSWLRWAFGDARRSKKKTGDKALLTYSPVCSRLSKIQKGHKKNSKEDKSTINPDFSVTSLFVLYQVEFVQIATALQTHFLFLPYVWIR